MDTRRIHAISAFLQHELRAQGLDQVSAVDAAGWLDKAGLLRDSPSRPGLPLRNILRTLNKCGQLERLAGAYQEPRQPYGRWWIRCIQS